MKKTTFVALMILSSQCLAGSLNDSLQDIESEWAIIHYSTPENKQEIAYNKLYTKVTYLAKEYPNKAEPLIWEAIIKACNADHINAVKALENIHDAHDLLQEAIKRDPEALGGSAYVTLGALYYMTPLWPIGFGDKNIAKYMFENAIKVNPEGLESNYFYAEFLQSLNQFNEAEKYYKKAISIPSRSEQIFADDQLRALARQGLHNTEMKKLDDSNSVFTSFVKKEILN